MCQEQDHALKMDSLIKNTHMYTCTHTHTSSLKYGPHTIQFAHLRYIIQWLKKKRRRNSPEFSEKKLLCWVK